MGICGNVFKTLKNMYENTSARIKLIKKLSDNIEFRNGVEQGHPLSPELFKIFIHELSASLNNVKSNVPELNGITISHLFWADDLVLLSIDEISLQIMVTILEDYCNTWGLTVNLKKTKILIFNKSGRTLRPSNPIILNGKEIDVTNSYCYLGIIFVPSGKFGKAIVELRKKALRATFKLRSYVSRHNLSPSCLFKLYDALISPILLYCAQVLFPDSRFSKAITTQSSSKQNEWKQHWLGKISIDTFEKHQLSFI